MLFLLFFLSGLSSFVYRVVWVREFSTAFGSTMHTASIVAAVFTLGLGLGGCGLGVWADRRYRRAPDSLLLAFGVVELLIAGLGVAIVFLFPSVQALAARSASYVRDGDGWFVLSAKTYVNEAAIACAVVGPSAILLGGTLTLVLRHVVRGEVESDGGWKIGLVYAVNIAGAAAGAFLTDIAIVPALGVRTAQLIACALNAAAGAGAIVLSRTGAVSAFRRTQSGPPRGHQEPGDIEPVVWTSLSLALSGFAAMGFETVWLRHFTALLGGSGSVSSLVLPVMLAGAGAGALAGGAISRRVASPERALMVVQSLVAVFALGGLAVNSFDAIAAWRAAGLPEILVNVRPMLLEIGVPSLLMGAAFPLANAVIHHTDRVVGSRAGVLYLAYTIGAALGLLGTADFLLPRFAAQGGATVLALAAGVAAAPLFLASLATAGNRRTTAITTIAAMALVGVAIDAWLRLPEHYLVERSLPKISAPEHVVAVREGSTETFAITEAPGRGRTLLANGRATASTMQPDQRSVRALVHVPLLSMAGPRRVLVIGFGVGTATHAASLHSSVQCVEVVDLSRRILEHANYFGDANDGVLKSPRVQVYINDARPHLAMQPEASYDFITLEAPSVSREGSGALSSREFYSVARSRLKPGGYISQRLLQPSLAAGRAMARAFVDAFPQSIVVSGGNGELLLVGTTADRIDIDPDVLDRRLGQEPDVLDDLRRVGVGGAKDLAEMFVGAGKP